MTALLTVRDVAKRTGLSEWRIRRYVTDRAIESIRTDPTTGTGHIRFTEEQYEALLALLTVPAKQPAPAKARKPRKRKSS